jgi:hypothetical protein
MNLIVCSVQWFLAIFFLAAGIPKISGRGLEQWTGFNDLPRPLTLFIGTTEVLGALGLVLPMATGILPWLTPLAALGLAVTVLMASGFHLRNDERLAALETTLWASIASIIAITRWHFVAARFVIEPDLVITTLVLLVPAAIVNVIILVKRPVPPAAPSGVSSARSTSQDDRQRSAGGVW